MTDDERREADSFISSKWPNHWPCLVSSSGENPNCHEKDFCVCQVHAAYAAACEAKQAEIADLKSELARAAQYMREAHMKFTPNVNNSLALEFIEKWSDPSRSFR